MGNTGLQYQPSFEVQDSKSIPGAADITGRVGHWGKTLSNPTATQHLPGHSADNANEAVLLVCGNANEGPFTSDLPRCHRSSKVNTAGSGLHYKGFCGFVDP